MGPHGSGRHELRRRYPDVLFMGALEGEALASAYRAADCFVFPSRTDTFGLVLIEALACGVPVAALPVAGPLDIVGADGRGPDNALPFTIGALDNDLAIAVNKALRMDRRAAAVFGASFSWSRATDQFFAAVEAAARRSTGQRALQPA